MHCPGIVPYMKNIVFRSLFLFLLLGSLSLCHKHDSIEVPWDKVVYVRSLSPEYSEYCVEGNNNMLLSKMFGDPMLEKRLWIIVEETDSNIQIMPLNEVSSHGGSPLTEKQLSEKCCGIYFSGGALSKDGNYIGIENGKIKTGSKHLVDLRDDSYKWELRYIIEDAFYIRSKESDKESTDVSEAKVLEAALLKDTPSENASVKKANAVFRKYEDKKYSQLWLLIHINGSNHVIMNLLYQLCITLHNYSGKDHIIEIDTYVSSWSNQLAFVDIGNKGIDLVFKPPFLDDRRHIEGDGLSDRYFLIYMTSIHRLMVFENNPQNAVYLREREGKDARFLDEKNGDKKLFRFTQYREFIKEKDTKYLDELELTLTGTEYRKFIDWTKVFRISYSSPDGRKLYLDANIGSSATGCISLQQEKPMSVPDQLFSIYSYGQDIKIESVYMKYIKKTRACILDSSDFDCLKFKENDVFYSNHQTASFDGGVSIGGYNLASGDIVNQEVVVKFDSEGSSNVKKEDLVNSIVYIMSGKSDYSVMEVGSDNNVTRKPYDKENYGQMFIRNQGFYSVLTGNLIEDQVLFLNSLLKEELVIKYEDVEKQFLSSGLTKANSILTPEERLMIDWKDVVKIVTIDPSSRFNLYLSSNVKNNTDDVNPIGGSDVSSNEETDTHCGGCLYFAPLVSLDQTDNLWLKYADYLISVDDYYGKDHLLKALSSSNPQCLTLCKLPPEYKGGFSRVNEDCIAKLGKYNNMSVGGRRLKRVGDSIVGYSVTYNGTDTSYHKDQDYFFEIVHYLSDAFYIVTGNKTIEEPTRVYDVDKEGRLVVANLDRESYTQLWKKDESDKLYNIIHGYVNVHNMLVQDQDLGLKMVSYADINQVKYTSGIIPVLRGGLLHYDVSKDDISKGYKEDDGSGYDTDLDDRNEGSDTSKKSQEQSEKTGEDSSPGIDISKRRVGRKGRWVWQEFTDD